MTYCSGFPSFHLLGTSTGKVRKLALLAVLPSLCAPFALQTAAAQEPAATATSALTVVDPYLMPIPVNHLLSAGSVVEAAAAGRVTAKGIMADGTSAAIAVYKTTSNKKVTISATNGAKVAAYNADFLTVVGAAGSSVVVSPARIGSSYYALALVISGIAPDAEHGVDTIVRSQSAGSTVIASAALVTLPTPVVLVHGLWGDQSSLASTESYLKATAAFNPYPFLVTPICYSDYLGFDAAADTIPGHGSGCEVTSATALGRYLSTTLYPQLDRDHYVGGRVDLVAHSMGGLVARHFSVSNGYKSVRNRMLGAFRDVITLDTPETGSALATYLDTVAYKRTLQSSDTTAQFFWSEFCSSTTATLETCFDNNAMPLSYPGTALSTGAVYSLIPGGMSIAHAPPANAFNTAHGAWLAIASDYRDGDQPPALLRDLLNYTISVTYTSGAPTLTSLLGTPDSDVIVTVASQTSTAPASHVKEFRDLEHTAAPSEGSLLFGSDSNATVVDSPAVNAEVAYWLGLQKTATPAVSEWPGDQINAEPENAAKESATEQANRPAFRADSRLSLTAPEGSVGLGQPVRIPLRLLGPKAVRFNVAQFSLDCQRPLTNEWIGAEPGSRHAWAERQKDGTTGVEFVPIQIGAVRVRVQAVFADGGYAQREFVVHVVPSQQRLQEFSLHQGFESMSLVLEDRDEDRQMFLAPMAKYETLRYPIYLDSSEALNLTVDQSEDDPVIGVDDNGLVHALREGKAIITGDFDGIRDSVEVEVYSKDDAPAGYRRA